MTLSKLNDNYKHISLLYNGGKSTYLGVVEELSEMLLTGGI